MTDVTDQIVDFPDQSNDSLSVGTRKAFLSGAYVQQQRFCVDQITVDPLDVARHFFSAYRRRFFKVAQGGVESLQVGTHEVIVVQQTGETGGMKKGLVGTHSGKEDHGEQKKPDQFFLPTDGP